MQHTIKSILLPFLCLALVFSSCKKNDKTDDDADRTVIQSDDQTLVAGETDGVLDDANSILNDNPSFLGRTTSTTALCNTTTVVDSTNLVRRITVTYNGTNCLGTRTRVGKVVLSLPINTKWKDAGAVLSVDVQSLKITRISDGKSITINGAYKVTNTSGGRLVNLATLNTIIHTVTSDGITVTFDNNSQRSWKVAKKRTFTYNNGVVISTVGTYTQGNLTGISEWGTNRYGNSFTAVITSPITFSQSCSFRLVSGSVQYATTDRTLSTTFGLDANGNTVSTCPTGNYYLKITWTNANGNSASVIRPY